MQIKHLYFDARISTEKNIKLLSTVIFLDQLNHICSAFHKMKKSQRKKLNYNKMLWLRSNVVPFDRQIKIEKTKFNE